MNLHIRDSYKKKFVSFEFERKVKADRIEQVKIGIFDPYLDTLGGGEKYILDIASCLSKKNSVFLFWNDSNILDKAKERFGVDYSAIKLKQNIFSSKYFFLKKLFESAKYDLIIYLSDGSLPFLLSKKNVLLFQFPVNWVRGKNLIARLKFKKVDKVICYSDFVKKFLDRTFPKESIVLPPAIDIAKTKKGPKENIILSVGRFTKALNTKKQDFLIDSFKKMCSKGLKGWKLILIGSSLPKDEDFVNSLSAGVENFPIKIYNNASFKTLSGYYAKAKIYWHAAGYGEDLQKNPEKAEHFGISTLEAMAEKAVPLVFNGGGQTEIVKDKKNGFLWNTQEELIDKTMQIIINPKLLKDISDNAVERAKDFSSETFCKRVNDLLI